MDEGGSLAGKLSSIVSSRASRAGAAGVDGRMRGVIAMSRLFQHPCQARRPGGDASTTDVGGAAPPPRAAIPTVSNSLHTACFRVSRGATAPRAEADAASGVQIATGPGVVVH